MIKNVAAISLPVLEKLEIRKNRLESGNGKKKRIALSTGVHGDELEGQYVCFEVSRRIQEHPEYLHGIVDIYPAMNPLGIDSITRGIPAFDLDMNRVFPGNEDGSMTEYLAAKIIEDLSGADLCIDIHASNIFLTEIPQVRINTLHKERLVPIARDLNIDLIWVHQNSTVLESTLAYSLNSTGTPTLVVEMGVGMRITKSYGEQLADGIFAVMKRMGMWSGPVKESRVPLVAEADDAVQFLNAPVAGIFISRATHGDFLQAGDPIGDIVDPLQGAILERMKAPVDGILFTIREYPVVDEGSLIARILKDGAVEHMEDYRRRLEAARLCGPEAKIKNAVSAQAEKPEENPAVSNLSEKSVENPAVSAQAGEPEIKNAVPAQTEKPAESGNATSARMENLGEKLNGGEAADHAD